MAALTELKIQKPPCIVHVTFDHKSHIIVPVIALLEGRYKPVFKGTHLYETLIMALLQIVLPNSVTQPDGFVLKADELEFCFPASLPSGSNVQHSLSGSFTPE